MLSVVTTNQFEKAAKRMQKRGKNLDKLQSVVAQLVAQKPLPSKLRDHKLVGNYQGTRECHIEPDWLLIYKVKGNDLVLLHTETHAELLG